MPIARRKLCDLLILALVLFPVGCGPEEEETAPTLLKVGVLPDDDAEALHERYSQLLAYLSEELDAKLELKIPADYAGLLELFGKGEIDLGYFGGLTFVQSHLKHGAVPLVMRDVDVNFTTYFLAQAQTPGAAVANFEGRRLAFGSELSTSGHLMPRYFLQEAGIAPESFFGAVRYSGAHDRTAEWVRDGVVDLGAANAEIVESMLRDGRLAPDAVRIVWETPPYANYVWAARPGLDKAFRTAITDAFLKLSPAEDRHSGILRNMAAGGFLPASSEDFARLREIMEHLPQFNLTE